MRRWNTRNGFWLLWYFCLHIGYVMRKLTDIVHKFSCLQTQWAVCLTVLSRSSSFLPRSKHTIAWRATPSCSSVWVEGECEETAMLDLMSFLNFHPNRFYLPQYFICSLSLLLSSLKGVCPNKLLIDLLCAFFSTCGQRACCLFLSFFITSPLRCAAPFWCWGQTLWFLPSTSGRGNIQGWKARYL